MSIIVDKALKAFKGTRGPGKTDEKIWAKIAWRIGAERFERAIDDKIRENFQDGQPKDLPATFQAFLDKNYPKPKKGGTK